MSRNIYPKFDDGSFVVKGERFFSLEEFSYCMKLRDKMEIALELAAEVYAALVPGFNSPKEVLFAIKMGDKVIERSVQLLMFAAA